MIRLFISIWRPVIKIKGNKKPLPTSTITSINKNGIEEKIGSMVETFRFFGQTFKIHSIYGDYTLKSINNSSSAYKLSKADDTLVAILESRTTGIFASYKVTVFGLDSGIDEELHPFILALLSVTLQR